MFDDHAPVPSFSESTPNDESGSLSPTGPQPSAARPGSNRPADGPLASAHAEPMPSASAPGKKSPEELAGEITTLAGHLNAAQHRFLKLLDEFDRGQGWAGPGVRSLAHWLNWKCGIGELAAREKVRVARALRELPLTDAAFESGEVSYSKVRAMTRAATPENEAQLLNIARHGTAEHMERLVRVYRRARGRAETPGGAEMRREERFWCFDEDDEMTVFGGRVPIDEGRLLMKALDAMVAEMDADEREEDRGAKAGGVQGGGVHGPGRAPATLGDVPAETPVADSGENVSAETAVEGSGPIVSAETPAADPGGNVSAETFSGGGSRSDPGDSGTAPLKPIRARRAAALARIAEHYLATGGSGATPLRSSEAHQVFVHVNANDANPDNRMNGGHTTYTDDRRRIAPHVARQLACDASRRTVLEDENGEVLNIGRRSRTVPWRIAHALRLRDGGCRFPGCDRQRWTDAHHIRHWADGGETSLDNLVTLCRFHHRSLHREEYRIERGADGGLMFIDAAAKPIPQAFHPQFGHKSGAGGAGGAGDTTGTEGAPSAAYPVERLRAEHRARGVEIDESTAVTHWAGEQMDYSTATEWLLNSDGVAV